MNSSQFPITWFDLTVVVVLFLGVQSGRKEGMSKNWLPCLQWFFILPTAALCYRPLGDLLCKQLQQWQVRISPSFGYIIVYLAVIAIYKIIFGRIRLLLPEKWTGGADIFGKSEYYLGMLAGLFRFSCILCAALALLNAPHYTTEEIAASQAFQQRWYGSDFFPSLQSIQHSVFKESIVGRSVSSQAGVLLIASNQSRR